MGHLHDYIHGRAVGEAGVSPPSHPLVRRELPRALTFEENDGLGEGVSVVVTGQATVVAAVGEWETIGEGDEEEESEKGKAKKTLATSHGVFFLVFWVVVLFF